MTRSTEERFDDLCVPEPTTGCWLWLGSTKAKPGHPYGLFGGDSKTELAHRWAFRRFRGPVPVGLELDHKCRTPQCVNPWHLEPVTHLENIRRGARRTTGNPLTTHCAHGHLFDDANTRLRRDGTRECRACRRVARKVYKQRRRAREVKRG